MDGVSQFGGFNVCFVVGEWGMWLQYVDEVNFVGYSYFVKGFYCQCMGDKYVVVGLNGMCWIVDCWGMEVVNVVVFNEDNGFVEGSLQFYL